MSRHLSSPCVAVALSPSPSRNCSSIRLAMEKQGQLRSCGLSFGTKSPYVAPSPAPPLPHLHEARLLHVSLIARHGTRNPTRSCISRMLSLHSWLRTALPGKPAWLDRWAVNLDLYRQNPGDLTAEGEQELWQIGSRFASTYATNLSQAGGTVRIRSSYKPRAVASARAFLDGYLHTCAGQTLPMPVSLHEGEPDSDSDSDPELRSCASTDALSTASTEDDLPVEVLPMGRDSILRFFEQHTAYATFASQHKALMRREYARGSLSHLTAALAKRLSSALEVTTPMDVEFVRVVAEACAFDYAHGRANASFFCRLITPQDAALLELLEKRHRPFFKAHEHFRSVAAPLVADLVESITACLSTSSAVPAYAADLRFAHAETLVPLLLLLGIQTNGLSPDHPDFQHGLSAMSPFAANFALELYESNKAGAMQYFVRFRLHERYVDRIPALGEHGRTGVVQLEHLLSFFGEVLDEGMHHYA